jgi:hypothetical protein
MAARRPALRVPEQLPDTYPTRVAVTVGYTPTAFVDGAARDTGAVLVAHRVVESQ